MRVIFKSHRDVSCFIGQTVSHPDGSIMYILSAALVSCILSAAEPVTGPVHNCCKFIGWLELGLGFPSNDVGLASLIKCSYLSQYELIMS